MKHLIFLFDGTNCNAPDDKFMSNVYNMNILLNSYQTSQKTAQFRPQICFYSPGAGTGVDFRPARIFDAIIASSCRNTIKQAYINLVSNCDYGDKIYIFGYSRGAVCACIFASMIAECGLLAPELIHYYNDIEKLYLSRYSLKKNNNMSKFDEAKNNLYKKLNFKMREINKNTDAYFENVSIEFLGLFDPVIGSKFSIDKFYKSINDSNLSVSRNVKNAVSIIAIDERRNIMSPTIWKKHTSRTRTNNITEVILIPGVHSDVGGQSEDCRNAISDISLLTMIDKMKQLKVDIDFDKKLQRLYLDRLSDMEISITKSNNVFWNLFGSNDRKFDESLKQSNLAKYTNDDPGFYTTLHPLYEIINNKNINIKGIRKFYSNTRLDKILVSPYIKTKISSSLEKAIKNSVKNSIGRSHLNP